MLDELRPVRIVRVCAWCQDDPDPDPGISISHVICECCEARLEANSISWGHFDSHLSACFAEAVGPSAFGHL